MKKPPATMSSIPEEIYIQIFVRVPVKSIFICKCVCKTWYALISTPSFVKCHLNRKNNPKLIGKTYYRTPMSSYRCKSVSYDSLSYEGIVVESVGIDYPFKSLVEHDKRLDVRFMASCNGLVICRFFYHSSRILVCIWNPVTGEYKKIPASPSKFRGDHTGCMYDFYYDCKTDDYKLVQIVRSIDTKVCLFQVYTLGSNSWTSVQTIPCCICFPAASGVFVNGALHWKGKMHGTVTESSSWSIICMEISNEKFKELQLPKEHLENYHLTTSIGAVEEHLCALVTDATARVCAEVWVMQDYGVGESWTRRYVITHEKIADTYLFRLMWTLKNGEMLFMLHNKDLVIYDPKQGSARVPNICCLYFDGEENYFESLVSLHSGTYVGGKGEIKSSGTW